MPAKSRTLWDMGVWRGTHMERESSGIALAPGAVFEARVTNGVPNISVDLMTDDSTADVPSIRSGDYWSVLNSHLLPASGEWKRFTAVAPSAAFFRLRSLGHTYGNTESTVPATVGRLHVLPVQQVGLQQHRHVRQLSAALRWCLRPLR